MDRKGAILTPILFILFAISLVIAGGLFYLYQKEHAQNIELQAKISDLQKQQSITENKLSETKKNAAELQLKLQEAKNNLNSITEDLNKEKLSHTETLSKLEQLKSDLDQQKNLRQDLENQLKAAQDDAKKIKAEISSLKQQKTELEEKIKKAEASVELGTVVVNNEPPAANNANPADNTVAPKDAKKENKKPAAKSKNLEGKVMVVNREFNFVVINLGSKDGVKLGDEFTIFSGSKAIGDIKIEKVHETMSAAGFSADLKDSIKENDRVSTKAK